MKAHIGLDASHSYLIVATQEPAHGLYLLTLADTNGVCGGCWQMEKLAQVHSQLQDNCYFVHNRRRSKILLTLRDGKGQIVMVMCD